MCNGTTVTCGGLSQWGTVALANNGYTPLGILRYYYGDDIVIDTATVQRRITSSYPGSPLTIGSRGIVLREIPQGDIGRVRVDGLDWQARTVDGTPLPKDAHCEVKNVDGAVLIVSAVPVPAAAQPAEQLH